MLDYLPIEKAVKCYSRLFVPLARLIPEGELDAFSLKCLGETLEIPQGYLVNLKGYLEPCLEGLYQEAYPGAERFTFVDYYYALALNLEDLRAMWNPKRASEFHEGRRVAKMWSRNYEGKGIDALAVLFIDEVRRQISAVELHPFNDIQLVVEA